MGRETGERAEEAGKKRKNKEKKNLMSFELIPISNDHDCLYRGKKIVIKWSIKMPENFSVV